MNMEGSRIGSHVVIDSKTNMIMAANDPKLLEEVFARAHRYDRTFPHGGCAFLVWWLLSVPGGMDIPYAPMPRRLASTILRTPGFYSVNVKPPEVPSAPAEDTNWDSPQAGDIFFCASKDNPALDHIGIVARPGKLEKFYGVDNLIADDFRPREIDGESNSPSWSVTNWLRLG